PRCARTCTTGWPGCGSTWNRGWFEHRGLTPLGSPIQGDLPMRWHTFHINDHVDDYLHELLSVSESEYVEEHCRKCSMCDAALTEARRRLTLLEAVPACEATEQLIQDTLTAVETRDRTETRRRKYVFRGVLGAVAAAVLLMGGFQLYYWNL